jgi:hypothetical protein
MPHKITYNDRDSFFPSKTPTRLLVFKLVDDEEKSYGQFDTFDSCFKAKGGDKSLRCQANFVEQIVKR